MNHIFPATLLLLLITVAVTTSAAEEWKPKINMESSASELFEIAHEIAVNAPSAFPKPTFPFGDPNVEVVVEPEIGKHRRTRLKLTGQNFLR